MCFIMCNYATLIEVEGYLLIRLLNPKGMLSRGMNDTVLNFTYKRYLQLIRYHRQSTRREVRTRTTGTCIKSEVTIVIPCEVYYGIKMPATHDTWIPLALQRYGKGQYKDYETVNHQHIDSRKSLIFSPLISLKRTWS